MVFLVCVPCHTNETFSKETETGDDMMANRTIIFTGERRSHLDGFFSAYISEFKIESLFLKNETTLTD